MKKETFEKILKDCLDIVNVDLRKLSTLEVSIYDLSDDMQEKARDALQSFYQAEEKLRDFLSELNKEI